MTVYSGKDVKVYFGEQEIDMIATVEISKERVYLNVEDYHGIIHRYISRPRITGALNAIDRGFDMLFKVMPYKTVISGYLVAKEPARANYYSIGNWELHTTDYYKVYGSREFKQYIYLTSETLSPNATAYAFGTTYFLIGQLGTTGATFRIALYRPDDSIATYQDFTLQASTKYWRSFPVAYVHQPNSSPYYFKLSVLSGTTDENNCMIIYTTNNGAPPYTAEYDGQIAIFNAPVVHWKPEKRVINMDIKIAEKWMIRLNKVSFGNITRGYEANNIRKDKISFTAEEYLLYQIGNI